MNIHQYSQEVLIFSGKLILPGFGCIKVEKQPAVADKGKFTPPSSRLIFDQSISMDDEVLSTKISEAEEIDREESKQMVMEFIDQIKFAIDRGDIYKIEGLGTLSRNENNDIVIERDPEFILDFESYGLESFELDEFADEEGFVEETEKDEKKEEILEKPDVPDDTGLKEKDEKFVGLTEEKISEETSEQSWEGEEITEEDSRSANRGVVWVILGLVVIIVSGIFLYQPITDFISNRNNSFDFLKDDELSIDDDFSDAEEGEFSFDKLVDELEGDIDSATSIENAMNISEPGFNSPRPLNENFTEYHIIAGSFRDFENAKELQQSLTLEGYQSLIIEPGNGIYRVSAMSFTDKPTALVKLIEFRDKSGLSEAWLMNLE